MQTRVKGIDRSTTFYELMLEKLTLYFQQKGYIDLNEALLYDFQKSRQHLSNEQMAMLIGTSFRFGGRHRLHLRLGQPPWSDHSAEIPDHRRQQPHAVLQACAAVRFRVLHHRAGDPDVASPHRWRQRAATDRPVSLYALADYLRESPKIAVMHNADDVILGPGDIGFLRKVFGDRLTLYPHGGHCGNLNYRVNSDAMLEFFRG